MTTKILLVGNDPELLQAREAMLRGAGLPSTIAVGLPALQAALQQQPTCVFVTCHSLPYQQMAAAVSAIQEQRPRAKILLLTGAGETPAQPAGCQTLSVFAGPTALIETVSDMLREDLPPISFAD